MLIFFQPVFQQIIFANEFDFFQRTISTYSNQVSPIFQDRIKLLAYKNFQKTTSKCRKEESCYQSSNRVKLLG